MRRPAATAGRLFKLPRANGDFHVVLMGDSHAAQWHPALSVVAQRLGWRLNTYTKGACPSLMEMETKKKKPYEACLEWNKRVLARLQSDRPDLVIVSNAQGKSLLGDKPNSEKMAMAMAATWRELLKLGATVIVLRDTPVFPFDPPACLSQRANCAANLRDVLRPGPIPLALRLRPDVHAIDMTDYLCPAGECPAAIGNLVVWRDKHHLTATFSKALAPILEQKIRAVRHSLAAEPRVEQSGR